MTISQGSPPDDKGPAKVNSSQVKELIDLAMQDPGVWYNIEVPEEATGATMRSTLAYNVAKSVSEWSIKDGVLYFRFGR